MNHREALGGNFRVRPVTLEGIPKEFFLLEDIKIYITGS